MNPRTVELVGVWTLRLIAWSVVAAVAVVLGDIVVEGLPAVDREFLTARPKRAGAAGGILPAIVGTLCLLAGTAAAALPVGLGAAVYFSEYAPSGPWAARLRLGIVTLSGVPSVVFGLLGFGLFVVFLGFGSSILAGSLTLALMALPVVIVAGEEALRAVPTSLREASPALGATPAQTIWKVVLPAALPGMLTGSVLGLARAAGETAPILLTVAAFYLPALPESVFDEVIALPTHLYILATQHPDAEAVRSRQYGTALVLAVLVLGLTSAAGVLRRRFVRNGR